LQKTVQILLFCLLAQSCSELQASKTSITLE